MCRAQENRRDGENLLWSLLSCCLQCVWGLIEYITKFATIRAAITGEAFFEAGRSVTDLLMRNALKAYGALQSSLPPGRHALRDGAAAWPPSSDPPACVKSSSSRSA